MEDTVTDFAARTRLAADLAEAQGFTHTALALRALLEDDLEETAAADPVPAIARIPATSAGTLHGRPGSLAPARRLGWVRDGRTRMARLALRVGKAIRPTGPDPIASSGR